MVRPRFSRQPTPSRPAAFESLRATGASELRQRSSSSSAPTQRTSRRAVGRGRCRCRAVCTFPSLKGSAQTWRTRLPRSLASRRRARRGSWRTTGHSWRDRKGVREVEDALGQLAERDESAGMRAFGSRTQRHSTPELATSPRRAHVINRDRDRGGRQPRRVPFRAPATGRIQLKPPRRRARSEVAEWYAARPTARSSRTATCGCF